MPERDPKRQRTTDSPNLGAITNAPTTIADEAVTAGPSVSTANEAVTAGPSAGAGTAVVNTEPVTTGPSAGAGTAGAAGVPTSVVFIDDVLAMVAYLKLGPVLASVIAPIPASGCRTDGAELFIALVHLIAANNTGFDADGKAQRRAIRDQKWKRLLGPALHALGTADVFGARAWTRLLFARKAGGLGILMPEDFTYGTEGSIVANCLAPGQLSVLSDADVLAVRQLQRQTDAVHTTVASLYASVKYVLDKLLKGRSDDLISRDRDAGARERLRVLDVLLLEADRRRRVTVLTGSNADVRSLGLADHSSTESVVQFYNFREDENPQVRRTSYLPEGWLAIIAENNTNVDEALRLQMRELRSKIPGRQMCDSASACLCVAHVVLS
eukprot:COSAG06_NODE_2678_length_6460_cov_2.134884_1_plen_384_part_00